MADTEQRCALFAAACWAFKRRERTTEPTAKEFDLFPPLAESVARQVQIEFERRVLRKQQENQLSLL